MSIYFPGLAHCLPFSKYAILPFCDSFSNCFMSTYFMDMLFGFLFIGVSFTVWDFMSAYFTDLLFVYIFSQYIILLSRALYVSTSNC